MARFSKKISGVKHSVPRRFRLLLYRLDVEFGEENVDPGYYHWIKGDGPDLHVDFKYYDPRRKAYRLQAKKGGLVEYFYVRLGEDCEPHVKEFVKRYL